MMAGGDRGDNTARWCRVCRLPCGQCGCRLGGCPPVPAADRQTDEERRRAADELIRLAEEDGLYDESPAARPAHADAVMADLGAAITEGVTEARLRERVMAAINAAPTDQQWLSHHDLRVMADAVLALPEMRALLDAAATVQRVEALVARAGRFAINPAAVRTALDGEG